MVKNKIQNQITFKHLYIIQKKIITKLLNSEDNVIGKYMRIFNMQMRLAYSYSIW